MDSNYSNSSVLPEPFMISSWFQGNSKLLPLVITPIQRINTVNPEFLPRFRLSNKLQNIVLLQLDSRTEMEWGLTSYYVKVNKKETLSSSTYKLGVLFKFDIQSWGLYYLEKDVKLKQLKELRDEIIEEIEPLVVEITDLVPSTEIDFSNFTMQPPATDAPNNSPTKDGSTMDPESYIRTKYYSALYSNADLMFFVKSTFSRLRLLSGTDQQNLLQLLSIPVLGIEEFNDKYNVSNEVYFENISNPISIEADLKLKYLEANVKDRNDDNYNIMKRKLKIREIKLQMILHLELVIVKEELESSKETLPQSKKKKPSLVRKKNKKKTLVPTLDGTLVDASSIDDTNSNEEISKAGVRKYMDMLIVTSSITDALDQNVDSKQKSDIFDFLSNIIIPFYYKKSTSLCKELIKTVKGVSMKRRLKKTPATKLETSLQPALNLSSKSQPAILNSTSSFSNEPVDPKNSKTRLDEFFASKPSLKRSSSMISASTKMLEKRTIDFSSSTNLKSTSAKNELPQLPKVATKQHSKGIFGTVPTKPVLTHSKTSICEIGETPVKKQKTVLLVNELQKDSTNLIGKLFEVAATPDHKSKNLEVVGSAETVDDRSMVGSSPLSLRWKEESSDTLKETITSPIAILSSPPKFTDETRDPTAESPFRPPTLPTLNMSSAIRRKQKEMTKKTPTRHVSLKRRRNSHDSGMLSVASSPKPGEPISLLRSPMVIRLEAHDNHLHQWNGSPHQKLTKKN